MKKSKAVLRGIVLCIGILGSYFALQFIVSFVFVNITGTTKPLDYIMILTIIADAVFLLFVIAFFALQKKSPLVEVGVTWIKISTGLLAFFIGLSFSLAYAVVTPFLFTTEVLSGLAQQNNTMYSMGMPITVLVLVFIQPITEEVLFRGLILSRLEKVCPKWVSLLVSSILFGVVHAAANIYLVPITFLGGLVFGYVYIKTKSLVPAILAHAGANCADLIANTFEISKPFAILICVVLMLIFFASLIGLTKKNSTFKV